MRSLSNETKTALSTPVREFKARVEVHRNSTLIGTYTQADAIKKVVIERIAEDGKFFGVGVSQKLNLTLVDKDRTFEIKKNDKLRVSIGIITGKTSTSPDTTAIAGEAIVGKAIVGTGRAGEPIVNYIEFPSFYVDEVVYDDISKEVSIVGYDIINKLKYFTVKDLGLEPPYSNKDFILACARKVGTTASMSDSYSTTYAKGGNFDGTENLRSAFDSAAESAGCVYYANDSDIIKVQPINTEKGFTVNGSNYFEATKSDSYQINEVVSITELGDNTTYQASREGVKANIYENPFLTYTDSLSANLQKIYTTISGISLDQYSLDWRGNLALEPFDEIKIITERYGTIISTVANDVITYDGGLSETTSWTYKESESADATLSSVISKTSAKVDKVNNTITLIAKDVNDLGNNYSELVLTTNGITSTVSAQGERISQVEQTADSLQTQITTVDGKATEAKQTADGFSQRITNAEGSITSIESSIDSIETTVQRADQNASSAKQTAESLSTRVSNAENDASEALQTANGFSTRISNAEGDISSLESTVNSMSSRITAAEGDASEALQTANSFSSRITSAEGDASEALQTANSFSSRITSAEGNINSIEQTLDGVAYKSSLAAGTTTINGGCITTGSISANRIKGGSISADLISGGTINADTVEVKNIKSANLIGKIPDGCISNANNYISTLRATTIYSAQEYLQSILLTTDGGESTTTNGILLNRTGIRKMTNGSTSLICSWEDVGSGGSSTATFG